MWDKYCADSAMVDDEHGAPCEHDNVKTLVPNRVDWCENCGAHRLCQVGLSIPAMDFLLTLQHPHTGGVLSAGPEGGLRDLQDGLSTDSRFVLPLIQSLHL